LESNQNCVWLSFDSALPAFFDNVGVLDLFNDVGVAILTDYRYHFCEIKISVLYALFNKNDKKKSLQTSWGHIETQNLM
jgi:hypothetical protein